LREVLRLLTRTADMTKVASSVAIGTAYIDVASVSDSRVGAEDFNQSLGEGLTSWIISEVSVRTLTTLREGSESVSKETVETALELGEDLSVALTNLERKPAVDFEVVLDVAKTASKEQGGELSGLGSLTQHNLGSVGVTGLGGVSVDGTDRGALRVLVGVVDGSGVNHGEVLGSSTKTTTSTGDSEVGVHSGQDQGLDQGGTPGVLVQAGVTKHAVCLGFTTTSTGNDTNVREGVVDLLGSLVEGTKSSAVQEVGLSETVSSVLAFSVSDLTPCLVGVDDSHVVTGGSLNE
jgi:hypothetical protein